MYCPYEKKNIKKSGNCFKLNNLNFILFPDTLFFDFHDPVTEVKQVLTRKGGFIMKVKLQDPLNAWGFLGEARDICFCIIFLMWSPCNCHFLEILPWQSSSNYPIVQELKNEDVFGEKNVGKAFRQKGKCTGY